MVYWLLCTVFGWLIRGSNVYTNVMCDVDEVNLWLLILTPAVNYLISRAECAQNAVFMLLVFIHGRASSIRCMNFDDYCIYTFHNVIIIIFFSFILFSHCQIITFLQHKLRINWTVHISHYLMLICSYLNVNILLSMKYILFCT